MSFLCSLDNFLLKTVSFLNQISKWRSFEIKSALFDLLFTFFSHQGKDTKILSEPISLTYIHVFCSPYGIDFFALPILQKLRIYHVWFLYWRDSGCWFFFRAFWNKQQITKWWPKLRLEYPLMISSYTNAKFIVICKPWTLNHGRWRLSSIQRKKKHYFVVAAILIFYR